MYQFINPSFVHARIEEYLNRFFTDSEKMLAELKLIMQEIKLNQAF